MKTLTNSLLGSIFLAASALATPVAVDITTGTGSTATGSSELGGYPASNGINGNFGDFTHTNADEGAGVNAWWEVNLGTDRTLNRLVLRNRGDGCCQYRLQDLTVIVKDSSNAVLATITPINPGNVLSSPSVINVDLPSSAVARYIRVERTPILGQHNTHDGHTLSLGEVLVVQDVLLPSGSNLTHSKIAAMVVSQSSEYGGFPAGNAVNSNTGDFTHTASSDSNASWTVNFGEMMNLESFELLNRGGACCQYRLRDITVEVRDASNTLVYTSAVQNPGNVLGFVNGTQSPPLTGSFPANLQGQYVTIRRASIPGGNDDANVLSLGEVHIYGSSIPSGIYEAWIASFGVNGADALRGADFDKDGLTNFVEFAFNMNPTSGQLGEIAHSGVAVTAVGPPAVVSSGGGNFQALFGMRLNRAAANLLYQVEFSANLQDWVAGVNAPTILATGSGVDAGSVPFPATINPGGGPVAPKFFRLRVAED